MKKWRGHITVLISLMFFVSSVIPVNAGWVDDWLTQHTAVGPTSIEGQKRGYFTAGSFSARWPTSNDRLFTLNPPHLKFGCGGIDLFLGGFSFLNVEYLVQKLQRVLTAAPAAAFDIALTTLCEQCSKTIKSLEMIADELNKLQIDDCKVGRAVAAEILSPLHPKKMASEKAEADKTFSQLKGIFTLPYRLNELWATNDYQPTQSENQKIAGCPADIKFLMNTGSVLSNIASLLNIPSEHIKLMRGYVGDVNVEYRDGKYHPYEVAPCAQNNPQGVEDFLSGRVYKREGDNCPQITDQNANLYDYAGNMIMNTYNAMKNKGTISQTEQEKLAKLPIPVLQAMKTAIVSGMDSTAITSLSDITARGYAMLIVSDLYTKLGNIISRAREMITKEGAYNMEDCQLELVAPVVDALEPLRQHAFQFARAVRSSFAGSAQEMNTIVSLSQRYEHWSNLFESELSRRFGPAGIKVATMLQ